MLKVIAYTGGRYAPSGIFRVQQYIKALSAEGIDIRQSPSWSGAIPPPSKWLRPFWGLSNLGERAPDVLRSFAYDLVFFQRELFSTFVTWEPFTRQPRIFDVDDAIWVHRGGGFAKRLAKLCDHVICGNEFLATEFSQWNPNITILPTPVNIDRFRPRESAADPERPIIGWMGLGPNLRHVYAVENALKEVLLRNPKAVLRIVSGERPAFTVLPSAQVEYVPWSAESEARSIQEMTIGIMPLEDNVFSRGKCSYKMLLYMACGLPVVVSPVGMNIEVLSKGELGFAAASDSDWVEQIDQLLRDPVLRSRMGAAGRNAVMEHYSVEALAPRLARTIKSVSGKTG